MSIMQWFSWWWRRRERFAPCMLATQSRRLFVWVGNYGGHESHRSLSPLLSPFGTAPRSTIIMVVRSLMGEFVCGAENPVYVR